MKTHVPEGIVKEAIETITDKYKPRECGIESGYDTIVHQCVLWKLDNGIYRIDNNYMYEFDLSKSLIVETNSQNNLINTRTWHKTRPTLQLANTRAIIWDFKANRIYHGCIPIFVDKELIEKEVLTDFKNFKVKEIEIERECDGEQIRDKKD